VSTEEVWNILKILFFTMRIAEIHKQRLFFDNKKDISRIVVLEIQTVVVPLLYISLLFLEKHQNLMVFQSSSSLLSLGTIWQILAIHGNFGQIWVDSTALPMADSMPQYGLKTLKPHNS
jgi:hypothetical protein